MVEHANDLSTWDVEAYDLSTWDVEAGGRKFKASFG